MTPQDAAHVVQEIFALYDRYGTNDYIGEPVSQIEHMSQSAELAILEGYDNDVVLAAFFHDIGHICVAKNQENSMEGFGVKSHEKIGADFLRSRGFPEKVAKLVEDHVRAKRYLTFKLPGYYDKLSDASKKTLEFQGGKMSRDEAEQFEKEPGFAASIRLREWDDLAKETGVAVIDLSNLKARATDVLLRADTR